MNKALQDSLRAFFYRPDGTRRTKDERLALVEAGVAAAKKAQSKSAPLDSDTVTNTCDA